MFDGLKWSRRADLLVDTETAVWANRGRLPPGAPIERRTPQRRVAAETLCAPHMHDVRRQVDSYHCQYEPTEQEAAPAPNRNGKDGDYKWQVAEAAAMNAGAETVISRLTDILFTCSVSGYGSSTRNRGG